MSLRTTTPNRWTYGPWELNGVSWAGIGTCITIPKLQLAFDVAQGLPFAFGMSDFLISHGHQDHAGGIPYIISQKALAGHKPAHFYLPPPLLNPMREILSIWQKIEGHQYEVNLTAAEIGQRYELRPNLFMQPFETVHRVPCQGYALISKTRKLAPQFSGLTGEQIQKLRGQGEEIHEYIEKPVLAFTGDTEIEFLSRNPWLSDCQVLIMEVTYIDNRKPIAQAKEWGHVHLDELLPLIPQLKCERIVLIHLSARYASDELERRLDRELNPEDRARIEIFPRAPEIREKPPP